MKKQVAFIGALLFFVLFLPGCAGQESKGLAAGKVYTYSGASFSGFEDDPFTITLNQDGTYLYEESVLSSYIGVGEWSVAGNVLTLADDTGEPRILNKFLIAGEHLVFIEDGSSNFIYVKVKEGERFYAAARQ